MADSRIGQTPDLTPLGNAPANLAAKEVEVVLISTRGFGSLGLDELWAYRELLYFLTWRDIKVRYKQTLLGAGWAIIQPFMTMLAFAIFFGRLARMPSDGIPYPLFCYVGLVPWTFFANALSSAGNSLTTNSNLLKKVYFPRLIIPMAAVAAGLVDLALGFIPLVALFAFYHVSLPWHALAVPLFLVLALVTALGVGLWFSAANVKFRDVRYVIPFVTQFWMFVTPIAYPSSLIQRPLLRTLYGLNPMTGVVEGLRWALLGSKVSLSPTLLAASTVASISVLVSGAFYFRRLERTFADVI